MPINEVALNAAYEFHLIDILSPVGRGALRRVIERYEAEKAKDELRLTIETCDVCDDRPLNEESN